MARILLVDDERDLVDVCEIVLEEEGYEVDHLIDGRSALELARRTHPALVILDWIMTDGNGEDVLRQLRSDPATARIPVLMMSAIHDGGTMARMYGADGFLKKPFTAEALLSAVQGMLPLGPA